MIDTVMLYHLSGQKGTDLLPECPHPIIIEPPPDADVTNDQMDHVNTILAIEELKEEQKCASIKERFNENN